MSNYFSWINSYLNNGQTTTIPTTISTAASSQVQCGLTYSAPNARITGGSIAIVI